MEHKFDIAIIGGGPAASTLASLVLKYDPSRNIGVFEREKFPRDHVGESHLPIISRILNEMGAWDKIEKAGFPVKIGATFRWGNNRDLWNFNFTPNGQFNVEPRPAQYKGQRQLTAFQVDRSIYDEILLDHAAELGAHVYEETPVRTISKEGDRVTGLTLDNGDTVTADWYIDASGHSGILRRAMNVPTHDNTSLKNIAIWGYWQNTEWAVTLGFGGTRIHVLSLGYGWIWFIPIGLTRTSIGLVVPAEYYKQSGKKPEELLMEAITTDEVVGQFIKNGTYEGQIHTTKDWSFVADRLVGENWFLVGESAGFADPIMSAGLTLAHGGARDVAYILLEEKKNFLDMDWLKQWYDRSNRTKIKQHIRFADYWYSANGVFYNLKEYTSKIAADAGLSLEPEEAFHWLGTGGFVDEELGGTAGVGAYNLLAVKYLTSKFGKEGKECGWRIDGMNRFYLNLEGAEKDWSATLANGRIERNRCYMRNGEMLASKGSYRTVITSLKNSPKLQDLMVAVETEAKQAKLNQTEFSMLVQEIFEALETMIISGWVRAEKDEDDFVLPPIHMDVSQFFHAATEQEDLIQPQN